MAARRTKQGWIAFCAAIASCISVSCPAAAQSTQCLISGIVRDETGNPLAGVRVTFVAVDGKTSGVRSTGLDGSYNLPLLAPGVYRLKAESNLYQPREYDEITLAVAGFLEVDFELRPLSDVFEQDIGHSFYFPSSQRLLNFYGPDIDTTRTTLVTPLDGRQGRLTTSVSYVIDPAEIDDLPLTGRDVYTALLLQPGVTADPAATRGLGFSVNGQRPSASSFLLDGVENNNYLISGPFLTPAPEAIQEYRMSTNNFSAEYGGTTGYIANAITRVAGPRWNGLIYLVGMNDALNANGFQENFQGYPRPALKQIEPGFRVGGPVWRERIFTSSSFEYLRLRARLDPQSFLLPSAGTILSAGSNDSGNLLKEYRAIAAPPGPAGVAEAVMLSPTSSLNQYLGLSRLDDQTSNGLHHVLIRVAFSQFDRPDYYWTPYTDFISGFHQGFLNVAAGSTDSLTPHLVNESRAAWGSDLLTIGENTHTLPSLSTCTGASLCLPSSTNPFAYRNLGRTWQALDNLTALRANHTMKFGAGLLARSLDGYLRNGANGSYAFQSLADFLQDNPFEYKITVARQNSQSTLTIPDFDRKYRYNDVFLFAQDSWRVNDHVAVNYGLRYEYFGAPVNVGLQKDNLILLGTGTNLPQKLMGAYFAPFPLGNQQLYGTDPHDWAPRFGISWLPWLKLPVLIRGAYGIFYDRPFDNLWQTIQNNSVVSASAVLTSGSIPYLAMAQAGPSSFPSLSILRESFQPTLFQPKLRDGMVQSAFTGIQSQVTPAVTVEFNALASRGRGLLTTDFINRDYSMPVTVTNLFGRLNPDLPPISYRANQGFSNYDALTALLQFNTKHLGGQIAYTWSHSIDNQSDPLAGDYNLEFSSVAAGGSFYGRAAFVEQFNSGADRGNSDFDQRQNLVFQAIGTLPAPKSKRALAYVLQNWRVAGLGSVRSGLPFNAYAIQPEQPLSNLALIDNRANVVDPSNVYVRQPIPGGVQVLNPAAFAVANAGKIGTAGRNAFAGPGTISANLSISRIFNLPMSGGSVRLVLRADAYNFLNHPNLYVNAENPTFGSPQFGTAQYGTTGVQTTFPVQVPLTATPRELQLVMRFEF
jgi:hypothetical protein